MGLFPSVESEWLYLVQYLHFLGAALIPLKIPLFEQLSASSLIEAQVDVLKKEVKIAEIRAEEMERDFINWDAISITHPALWAVTKQAVIGIPISVVSKKDAVVQSTATIAKSLVDIIKPQT